MEPVKITRDSFKRPSWKLPSIPMKVRRGAGAGLLCISALAAGNLVHQVFVTDYLVAEQHQADVASMKEKFALADAEPTGPDLSAPGALIRSQLVHGQPFGVMYVPRLGEDWAFPLIEGTEHDLLNKGITHEPYTSLPGEKGNFGVAGHRVTYGRPFYEIDTMVPGDQIIVETVEGWAVYSVTSSKIVEATETSVYGGVAPDEMKNDSSGSWITMVACHPEWSDEQRYVVFGRLIELRPRAAEQGPMGVPGGEAIPSAPPVVATPTVVEPSVSQTVEVTQAQPVAETQTPAEVVQVPVPAPVPVPQEVITPTTIYETVVETIYQTSTSTPSVRTETVQVPGPSESGSVETVQPTSP